MLPAAAGSGGGDLEWRAGGVGIEVRAGAAGSDAVRQGQDQVDTIRGELAAAEEERELALAQREPCS